MEPALNALAPQQHRSVIVDMAARFGMDPRRFEETLRGTVGLRTASNEEFAAFLLVAKQYSLNPITKELYAFPGKGGGIVPIVSIDGWMRIINDHDQMDGLEFDDHLDEAGKLISITARIYRKDRTKPIAVTEYMAECRRETDTWKKWPSRMLRHKAAIQAARYAFGFSGVYDPDEGERMADMKQVKPSFASLKKSGVMDAMLAQIAACSSFDDLEQWYSENERAIDALPDAWREAVSDKYEVRQEQLADQLKAELDAARNVISSDEQGELL
jgi:phage recombination protein Bet